MLEYPSFAGAVTELITPFTADGGIDFDALRAEVEFQVGAGIKALFTNGLASESLSLTGDEQIATTRLIVEAAAGRVPVMGNVAANTLPEAKRILAGYESAGADAVCFQAPCVYAVPQDALASYLGELARSTGKPAGFYNAPQTGNVASPGTVAKVFNGNGNMVYYKESTIDFVHIQNTMRLIDKEMEFLNGSDATTFSVMQLGGKGVVSLISAVFPQPVIGLVDAFKRGDCERARETQDQLLKIREALKTGPFVAGYKYASGLLGRPLGYMRKPLAELNDAEKEKIKAALSSIGAL